METFYRVNMYLGRINMGVLYGKLNGIFNIRNDLFASAGFRLIVWSPEIGVDVIPVSQPPLQVCSDTMRGRGSFCRALYNIARWVFLSKLDFISTPANASGQPL